MWVIRHQAEPIGHLHRHPLRGGLMRIGFDSRRRTCAHTVSHPIAAAYLALPSRRQPLGLSGRAHSRLQRLQPRVQRALLRGLPGLRYIEKERRTNSVTIEEDLAWWLAMRLENLISFVKFVSSGNVCSNSFTLTTSSHKNIYQRSTELKWRELTRIKQENSFQIGERCLLKQI